MLTYLFDASAAVELYASSTPRAERAVRYIVDQKKVYKEAALYIPNI